ncbi:MAG TPA: ATP-binding protein [Flavobacteriales bacterium]|nr:ATP-binding protein [Flavobacteriales bacterium]HQZ94422.1 ATP-binding protein [Flavobacteriales bacterium]
MKTAKELFDELNAQDESTEVEAKGAGPINRSVMESVCAFCNEPGLGGGYILIGADKDESDLFPYYTAEDVGDTDKLQSDLATQCAGIFNLPVRPRMVVEQVNGMNVLVVHVHELPTGQKPLHFKNEGLPKGAYRRIGPTDHRCTEDDMPLFYSDRDTYDRTVLNRTNLKDIDTNALSLYRTLRGRVNPAAEELALEDAELLLSLGCLDPVSREQLTVAGLLLFGSSAALRREMPMVRADYIRVPGTEWVQDPDERFRSVDMRGPLVSMVYRLVDAIFADLPRGFRLEEGQVQADSTGLPVKALREAVVNALMHRSYRVHSPVQVIRYDNRIEIRNPGYSLKSEDLLGSPGSEQRNPNIAAVFHETNLAETKGTGIRAMRGLLEQAHLAPPTFESDRAGNVFTTRLLLHHFLSEEDLVWLNSFDHFDLNDNQKRGLIMLRELGAIDNLSYRQQSGTDTLTASQELRAMRDSGLLEMKGKGSKTHYVPGQLVTATEAQTGPDGAPPTVPPQLRVVKTMGDKGNTQPLRENTQPLGENTQPLEENTQPPPGDPEHESADDKARFEQALTQLPQHLQDEVQALRRRVTDHDRLDRLIVALCQNGPCTKDDLALLLGKREDYLRTKYINGLLRDGRLNYLYPEVLNHPQQAYVATGK